jgi:hypothetical protein
VDKNSFFLHQNRLFSLRKVLPTTLGGAPNAARPKRPKEGLPAVMVTVSSEKCSLPYVQNVEGIQQSHSGLQVRNLYIVENVSNQVGIVTGKRNLPN